MIVSAVSKQNYYELIVPSLSETKKKIYEIIKSHPKGVNSFELTKILGKEHHKFSGRLTDLVSLDMIRVDRTETVNGSTYGVWVDNLDESGNPKPKLS
jgi:predicted HTH transcriptional regulator